MRFRHLLHTFLFAGLATFAAADERVPLKLDLPKPFFLGTPTPVQLPNLERPRTGKRPDFLVPAGAVNLAKGAPVASSDDLPVIGELAYLTDGEKTGADGTFVELGPGLQWVQIDLGKPAALHAIVFWHFHSQPRAYHDVVVQVSDDPAFKTGVQTVFNNDHDNTAKLGRGADPAYMETFEGRIVDPKGVTGRYVRLYSAGNTSDELNHYIEVEVYGLPGK
jgi:hypothetical protein